MAANLSNLFSGGANKPAFEFVSKRVGPFSGRRMKLATNDPRSLYEFQQRNLPENANAQQNKAVA